ncbi:uncharacterized protein LOC144133874 [Amblyomma americanum]
MHGGMKQVKSPDDGTTSGTGSGAGSRAPSAPPSGATSGTASSTVTSPPERQAPAAAAAAAAAAADSAAPAATSSASSIDEGTKKRKRETADQAVLPTLVHIIQRKLRKRFKETRDFVMFLVVVVCAIIYLIISSKLILDYLELPDDEKGSLLNITSTGPTVVAVTYPPSCIGSDGTIACLPEAQYMDDHLSKMTLCSNPYGSVCNENYFHSGERRNPSLWPYRYASLQYIYETIWRAIIVDFNNFTQPVDPANETPVYKTLYFIKNCTSEQDRAKIHAGHIKRVLAKVGLPSSPYSSEHNETFLDVAVALGQVMRSLGLKLFFVVDFVAEANSPDDAPFGKKVLLRKVPYHIPTGERRRDNEATEESEYVYTMLKTPHLLRRDEHLYDYITEAFYWFAKTVAQERHKWTEDEEKKSVTLAELTDATAIKEQGTVIYKGFNWTLFFNTLLYNTSFVFKGSTKVNVEDYDSIISIMKMVQNSSAVTVLNYITLAAWSLVTPLLPKEYVHKLLYLPGSDYVALGTPHIRSPCFKLAEQFCPEGMAAVIWEKVLKFPDKQAVTDWQKEIADIYRHYIKRFLQGLSDIIIPGNATSVPDKNKYFKTQIDIFAQRNIRVAIPEKHDKDVSELKCEVPIKTSINMSADDVVLYYFVDAVKKHTSAAWNARFTQVSTDNDKSTASSFVFNIHYFDDHIFVPLVYAASILKYPSFKETFVMMSLGDALKGLMRHLFDQRGNADTTRIRRGVPIVDIVWQNATAVEGEYRNALNLTDNPIGAVSLI